MRRCLSSNDDPFSTSSPALFLSRACKLVRQASDNVLRLTLLSLSRAPCWCRMQPVPFCTRLRHVENLDGVLEAAAEPVEITAWRVSLARQQSAALKTNLEPSGENVMLCGATKRSVWSTMG